MKILAGICKIGAGKASPPIIQKNTEKNQMHATETKSWNPELGLRKKKDHTCPRPFYIYFDVFLLRTVLTSVSCAHWEISPR